MGKIITKLFWVIISKGMRWAGHVARMGRGKV